MVNGAMVKEKFSEANTKVVGNAMTVTKVVGDAEITKLGNFSEFYRESHGIGVPDNMSVTKVIGGTDITKLGNLSTFDGEWHGDQHFGQFYSPGEHPIDSAYMVSGKEDCEFGSVGSEEVAVDSVPQGDSELVHACMVNVAPLQNLHLKK